MEQIQKNLKILHAVIRTPVLVEKYAKQARKQETPSRKISQDLEAFMTLKQNNFDEEKADGFIKELSTSVHQCLYTPEQRQFKTADQRPTIRLNSAPSSEHGAASA